MKSVIVATCYDEWQYLPAFLRGIEANRDFIERVLIVHDGPFDEPSVSGLPRLPDIPLTIVATKTRGGNPVDPLNLAMSLLPPEAHVVGTALDMVLGPTAVGQLHASAQVGRFTTGLCLPVGREPTTAYPPEPVDKDFLSGAVDHFRSVNRYWRFARNGLFGCFARDWQEVGGHNPRLSRHTYASEEYDLALRWLQRYGPTAFDIDPLAIGYHHEDSRRGYSFDTLYRGKLSLYPSRLIMAETYLKFYSGCVQMFCTNPQFFRSDFLNVKHIGHFPETFGWHYDVWLDCWHPEEWIPPGGLLDLHIPYLPLHWDSPKVLYRFLDTLPGLMPSGARFNITLQPHRELTVQVIADHMRSIGFELDGVDDLNLSGWRE